MPRAAGVGWALLAYSFVIGMFGGLFEDLPEAASWISPFFWVSAAFTEEFSWPAFVGLTTTAGVLFLLALVGLRRRDIGTA